MSKALRVLITGAARGIGTATAQVLANRGHSVVATDISASSGLEGIQTHVLDVTSDDSVARCLEVVGSAFRLQSTAEPSSQGAPALPSLSNALPTASGASAGLWNPLTRSHSIAQPHCKQRVTSS
jgi:NAD(P)-dependent dehydrogenase (short-subunit alcohol dehydrogenase family)